jgi:hypothetical protein
LLRSGIHGRCTDRSYFSDGAETIWRPPRSGMSVTSVQPFSLTLNGGSSTKHVAIRLNETDPYGLNRSS